MMIRGIERSSEMDHRLKEIDQNSGRRARGMRRSAEERRCGFRMGSIIRWALGFGFVMLLLMSLAVTGQAYPSDSWKGGEGESPAEASGRLFDQIADLSHPGDGPPVLISIVRSDRGVALGSDNETLTVRLQVERVRGVDPSEVRRLLGENRTLGEIKAEIEGDDRGYVYRGNIRLGHAHYLLENLTLASKGGNSTLAAELADPVWGAIPTTSEPAHQIAGTVSIETRRLEDGTTIGVGNLLIFGGPYAGSYLVILDSSVGGGCGMESCPAFLRLEDLFLQGVGPSSSTWRGPGFGDPFMEMILAGPGPSTVPSSWGRSGSCFGCPLDPDLHFMISWDLIQSEPEPEDLGWREGLLKGEPICFEHGNGHHGASAVRF
jgi:hypothetical protein